jgi:hypothetical protein
MTPLLFSFVATRVGHYAIVSGIPGYAVGGMWDHFNVADVAGASFQAKEDLPTNWHAVTRPGTSASNLGALEGVITDASTGKPVPGALVVLGWSTLKRVGETDANAYYRIDNVPPVSLVDAYGFAEGYLYYHGHPIPIKAGQVTVYSFQLPRQTFPRDLLPVITQATISVPSAVPGTMVTFEAHITPGPNGPLSAENFAVNARLGVSVLLLHVGNDVYRGTWQIPEGISPGSYQFHFITTITISSPPWRAALRMSTFPSKPCV